MTDRLAQLSDAGVSIWLDDLSRELLNDGSLGKLVSDQHVVGVTTNPTIFASALSKGDAYDEQLREIAAQGKDVDTAIFDITTADVRDACDVLRPVYDRTDGQDGRVSIEVDPRLAHDTTQTIEAARKLWATVDRPNVMIKIPATVEGLPAITQAISEGISVNVTLIFALDRYRGVMQAFLTGLEQAREKGLDLSTIRSVASFFVSRVDTEVDKRLDALGTDEAKALRGQAGIANARLAFHAFEEVFGTPRWEVLAGEGAHPQRPLWASTGVKDPAYPDTMYVTELVTDGVVNTMPSKTMDAVADHGELHGDTVRSQYDEARQVLDALERLGISYTDVTSVLEREGVEKFEKSWDELMATVNEELAHQASSDSPEEARQ
ncbi:transaldolase [Angustibacter sp. Root456]|uniref:transaldolase n=1 Tax=Angustibacter sp. Root456 TaxID=1736539 RepID=UPI0006F4AE03|nr:transaldolase [Angustibacter sp. Root456]KQX66615.1 transaldolase [Angustibacter sp. Root456]